MKTLRLGMQWACQRRHDMGYTDVLLVENKYAQLSIVASC